MEKRNIWRSLTAGLLLAAIVLAAPLMLTTSEGASAPGPSTPTILLDGMSLRLDNDGNIQAYIDVWTKGIVRSHGTVFYLKYNPEWLEPSDYYTNEVIPDTAGMKAMTEGDGANNFFVYNPDLYIKEYDDGRVVREMPFGEVYKNTGSMSQKETYYRQLDNTSSGDTANMMQLTLYLDRYRLIDDFAAAKNGDYTISGNIFQSEGKFGEGGSSKTEIFNYLAAVDENGNEITASANTAIKLGTLSFRVASREALRDMVMEFGGKTLYWFESNTDATDKNTPIYADATKNSGGMLNATYKYPWNIWAYVPDNSEIYRDTSFNVPNGKNDADKAAAEIHYDFGHELISAELLRPEVTINAYRAYSEPGTGVAAAHANVAAALQKYSPTVVASYADMRVQNFTMNWGAANTPDRTYDFTVYTRYTGTDVAIADVLADPKAYPDYHVHYDYSVVIGEDNTVTEVETPSLWKDIEAIDGYEYDPRQGEYIATQYFYYTNGETDELTGAPIYYRYPNPMEAHLTVTPVTVIGVTADGLEKRYTAADALEKKTTDELELPGNVRILTDIISGAPGLYLDVGSEGAYSLPGWLPATNDMATLHPIKDDGSGPDADRHWPTNTDPDKGAGDYIFNMGTENTDGGVTTTTPYPEVLREDIRAKYPWLTAKEDYPITAVRRVAEEGEEVHVYRVKWVSTTATAYRSDQTDYTNDDLILNLAVAHNETGHTFGENAAFRVRMPNGRMIETGSGEIGDGDTAPENWFDEESTAATQDYASYKEEEYPGDFGGDNYTHARKLVIKPGLTAERETTSDDDALPREYVKERAELRRMINLGGYFEISINEDITDENEVWSEFYPVYVPPRQNDYEENKEYNFIGLNAGLFDYRGSVSDTLTFPRGEYYPIETQTAGGKTPNTFRTEKEDYGVLPTYDGETGDQPGRTYTFRVEHSNTDGVVWDVLNPDNTLPSESTYFGTVSKYNSKGDNDFTDMTYNGYGKVTNPTDAPHEPVLRFAELGLEKQVESLHLIYEGTETLNVLSEPRGAYNEVTDVIFDTQTEGYIVRQSFVLTLLNAGTTDIDGIYIDTDTDINIPPYNADSHGADSYASHFYISDKPASFLAAGCKTTFTVTYVYDLRAGDNDVAFDYLDKLYVCSNRSGTAEYLCEFDAHFAVTGKAVNRVTVIVLPPFVNNTAKTVTIGDKSIAPGEEFYLGEAGVIGGLPLDDSGQPVGTTMDYTYASSMKTFREQVYIGTFPYEEYEVRAVMRTESGALVSLDEMKSYDGVYNFEMPSRNVTVYVIFREPTISKLRPAEINVYAAETEAKASDRTLRDQTRKVMWQKSFTDAEVASSLDQTNEIDHMKLMRGGKAAANSFNASIAHYLVVLEYEEEYVQAEALLRKVLAISDPTLSTDLARAALKEIGYEDWNSYKNLDIDNIDIDMAVYRYKDESMVDKDSVEQVYSNPDRGDDLRDGAAKAGNAGDTSVPTKHTSTVFRAPTWGAREWLVITLGYDDPGLPGKRVERSYYIELVRRPSYSVTKNYGNSPVGMIYNTEKFRTDAGGDVVEGLNDLGAAVLKAFESTRSFAGLTDRPYAIEKDTSGIGSSLIYNREAWVGKGLLYDPDSLTSVDTYYVGSDRDGNRINDKAYYKYATDGSGDYTLDLDVVDEYADLDLDPYSLFVLLGRDFDDPGLEEIKDSSMRSVEPERVRRYITGVVLLDESASTQVGRFDGATETAEDGSTAIKTVDIELGTLADEMHLASAFWQATHSYTQATHYYLGTPYPVYVDRETGNEYFLYDSTYWDVNTQLSLRDDEIAARLEPKMIDHPTKVSIRPGVYTLVYEFKDFDSVVDEDREPLRETRKIIILGRVGDVNADDFVENDATYASAMGNAAQTVKPSGSDESIIEKRVYDPLGQDSINVLDSNVIKFRTADVNNDRNVNDIDANALHSALDGIRQFYEPSGYSNLPKAGTEGGASR